MYVFDADVRDGASGEWGRLDPTTGVLDIIGNLWDHFAITATSQIEFAFNPTTGDLLVSARDAAGNSVFGTLDVVSGGFNSINTAPDFLSFAFHPDGTIYASRYGSFGTIDTDGNLNVILNPQSHSLGLCVPPMEHSMHSTRISRLVHGASGVWGPIDLVTGFQPEFDLSDHFENIFDTVNLEFHFDLAGHLLVTGRDRLTGSFVLGELDPRTGDFTKLHEGTPIRSFASVGP